MTPTFNGPALMILGTIAAYILTGMWLILQVMP